MKTQAIIVSAGLGVRLGADKPKAFVEINQKPILAYTLEVFEKCAVIDSIIVVSHPDHIDQTKQLMALCGITKSVSVTAGGQTRSESVLNGLKKLEDDAEYVVIHDGARPFVTGELLERTVNECKDFPAVVAAVQVIPTIKQVDQDTLTVKDTPDRATLWEIQTPQVFKKDVIVRAHEANKESNPTDDAALVERLGLNVKVVAGDYRNIKVTTAEDLIIAEAFLNKMKTGPK